MPHQQWVPPIRRPAAPRWLRERAAASGVDEGGGGGGGILASRPRWPEGSDERMGARTVVSTSRFNFSFPGAKRGLLGLERSFPLPISNSRFRGQKEACWTSRTVVSTSYFEFSFPGAKKGLPEGSLWEIVISLSCEQNSARKFQSGVSNSGFQIPKHARQNSEVTENSCFTLQKPMERPQNSSRRFLDSCFCFRVPFRGWNLGRFPFPISRFSVQIQGR